MMKKTARLIALVVVVLVLGGCVTSQFMTIGDKTYPPRHKDYVIDTYLPSGAPVNVHKAVANAMSMRLLPSSAAEIGRIDTQGNEIANWVSVLSSAKRRARQLGGDAIVIRGWGNPMTGVNGYGQSTYGKSISMAVVRY